MRRTLVGGVAAMLVLGAVAQAQTAGDINRLNAAIQICNSPTGAGMAECAKLRGQLGGGSAGGGAAGAVGGLLGALSAARPTPAAPSQPQVNTAAVQHGVAACVKNAAGDNAAIQACLTSAAARPAAPTARTGLGIGAYQAPAARATDTATAIHQAGQSYQACAAANPSNWQSCLPLLNGGSR